MRTGGIYIDNTLGLSKLHTHTKVRLYTHLKPRTRSMVRDLNVEWHLVCAASKIYSFGAKYQPCMRETSLVHRAGFTNQFFTKKRVCPVSEIARQAGDESSGERRVEVGKRRARRTRMDRHEPLKAQKDAPHE